MTRLPRPLCFGATRAELFGWLHESAAPSPLVLVICSPFGNEEVFAHRALRHLAQASAAAGIPALRFDYHGTGDSAGDEMAPGRVDAWVSSVHQAIAAAKQHTGAAQVCLLGVRFGATLAALAAASRSDIVAMAAIAAVTQGRAHVRELKLMNMASTAVAEEATVPARSLLDSSNFVLSPETMREMAAVDLLAIDRAPAPRMLLIERDDLPGTPAWAEQLHRLGAEVASPRVAGYKVLMEGHLPGRVDLPTAMIEQVVRWLQPIRNGLPAPAALGIGTPRPAAWPAFLDVAPGVREQPLRIPAGAPLFGMLSAPSEWPAQALKPDAQAVLLLPAGVGRRIGQGRLYVELARQLASQGHVALRVDLSGIGDSPAHAGHAESSLYERHAIDDIAAAANYLRQLSGAAACHLVGHCSGAYNAFHYAAGGAPVVQVVQINPLIFSVQDRRALAGTPAEPLSRRHTPLSPRWVAMLQSLSACIDALPLARRLRNGSARRWQLLLQRGRHLVAMGYRNELRRLAARGVDLHFIFDSDGSAEALLRQQAGSVVDAMLERHQLTVLRMPDTDHILSRWHDRQTVRDVVAGLIKRREPALVQVSQHPPETWPSGGARSAQ